MSLDCQTKDRLERSCHLSIKQYNIILSYLNTGIKPSAQALQEADLLATLNGGVNKCGKYHRLRSLASRLSLRPTDGALVFASNGKVVIPSSKFVQTIKQAHKNGGGKHLNVTQTLAKLQETYTIGRRQFGMCEDQIRDVVKSCNQGSCRNSSRKRPSSTSDQATTPAKKSKPEEIKTPIKPANEQTPELIKSLTSVTLYQAPGQSKHTTYIPNQPTQTNLPGLALGNVAVQTGNVQQNLINTQNCFLVLNPAAVVVPPSTSLTDLQRFTNCNPPKSVQNNVVMFGGQTPSACNYNLLPKPTVNGNLGPVQSPASTFNVQPQIGTNVMFLQNITTPASNSIKLVYSSNPVIALPMCPPSATCTSTETLKDCSSLSEVNSFIDSFSDSDKIKSPVCSTATLLETSGDLDLQRVTDLGDLDLPRVTDLNNNDIELTWPTEFDLSRQNDPVMSDDEENPTTGGSQDPVVIDDSDADSIREENVIPHPNIWHYHQDFTNERCPYRKICIGIQDMRLDLMKSLVGDNVSAERLKKKIVFLHQLVQREKKATEPCETE